MKDPEKSNIYGKKMDWLLIRVGDGKNEQARACTKKFSITKDITENWTVTVSQLYIFA